MNPSDPDQTPPAAPPASRRQAAKRWAARFLLLAVVGVLCVLFMEMAIRLLAPQPASWLDVYRHHPTLNTFTLQRNAERLVETGETRFTVVTDEHGFRVSKGASDEEGRSAELPLALCLGDSFTFAHGVDHGQSWVGLLNDREERRYRFLNAGVSAYGPVQYRRVLEYLLGQGYEPELLIVATYMGNDFYDCMWDKDQPITNGVLGDPGGLKSFLKRNTHLYRLAANVYHRIAPEKNMEGDELRRRLFQPEAWKEGLLHDGLKRYREEFARIQEICRKRSIPLYVAIFPTYETVAAVRSASDAAKRTGGERFAYTLPVEKAAAIFESLGLSYVDTTAALAEREATETYFRFNRHFTPLGHRLVVRVMKKAFPLLGPPE